MAQRRDDSRDIAVRAYTVLGLVNDEVDRCVGFGDSQDGCLMNAKQRIKEAKQCLDKYVELRLKMND